MSKSIWPKRLTSAAAVAGALLLGANILLQAQEHKGEMMMMQTAESKKLEKHVNAVKAKGKASKEGYACCIRPSCEWCAVHMGHCTCHHGVDTGMGNCRECHGGWEAGQGEVKGKTKEDIRNQPVMKM
jgi:hypothetical protein